MSDRESNDTKRGMMGLDQALMLAKKPSDADIEFLRDHFASDSTLLLIDMEDVKEDGSERLFRGLEPYSVMVRAKSKSFNEKRFRSDFGISSDMSIWEMSGDPGTLTITYGRWGETGAEKIPVTITDDDYQRYEVTTERDFRACDIQTIFQWRKRYDIQDVAYRHLPVENCGYYVLDDETIADISTCGVNLDGYETNDEQAVVYWEGY